MRIGIAQIECIPGDTKANVGRIAEACAKARADGSSAVVLPELCDTGYDFAAIRACAQPWNGRGFSQISGAAKQHGLFMLCGLAERDGEQLYNSLAVFGPHGQLAGKYRKTHLFTLGSVREEEVFTPGTECASVKLGSMRFGLQICFDLRFPEVSRTLALAGADVLTVAAAWPAERIAHFRALCIARAIENQCFVVAANRCGTDSGILFGGSSCIIDPTGAVVAEAGSETAFISADIDVADIRRIRAAMPLLNLRRPNLYSN